MALQLRQGCVTDLPAIYRGEESYIRCWEPDHEAVALAFGAASDALGGEPGPTDSRGQGGSVRGLCVMGARTQLRRTLHPSRKARLSAARRGKGTP